MKETDFTTKMKKPLIFECADALKTETSMNTFVTCSLLIIIDII